MRGNAGVWALFGKKPNSEKWDCLQVCETSDMGTEMMVDFNYINSKAAPETSSKKYINQWGNNIFSFDENPSARQLAYYEIGKQYNVFKVVVVKEEDSQEKRRLIEKYFAASTLAVYWRNGRVYTEEPQNRTRVAEYIKQLNALKQEVDCKKIDDFLEEYNSGEKR